MNAWVLILIFTGGANSSSPAVGSVPFDTREACQAAMAAVVRQVNERNRTEPHYTVVKGVCAKKGAA